VIYLYHPPGYLAERQYVYDVIFTEFLGVDYQSFEEHRTNIRIVCGDTQHSNDSRELTLCDVLMQAPEGDWLKEASLPTIPLEHCAFPNQFEFPIIYGKRLDEGSYYKESDTGIDVGVDVFGSIFFMLSRYEELVKPDRDARARFPAAASLAYQEKFLDRPIVNEYVDFLFTCLQQLWPHLTKKKRDYRIFLSHDVDVPLLAAGRPLRKVMKNAAGDIIRRREASIAMKRFRSYLQGLIGNYDRDDGNTFNFIMDLSERKGIRSAFYFITNHSAGAIDGDYSMQDQWIRHLLRHIHKRGHEIGLHPSYNSYDNVEILSKELSILHTACDEEGIAQERWGGRQHYLRFDIAETWRAWEEAGLHYDSTLSFADHIGFRSGVCYEYPVFDLQKRMKLQLRERPLVVMEQSLLHKDYMRVSVETAYHKIMHISKICKKLNGDFTLLWHNDQLIEPAHRDLYKNVVEGI